MRLAPARTLASAGTAGASAVSGAAAYLFVGGLPGLLYAAGIFLAGIVGATAIVRAGRAATTPELDVAPRTPRWRREFRVVERTAAPEVTDPEALASGSELEDLRAALANLGAQLKREQEAARRDVQRLDQHIRELEAERDAALAQVAEERTRFEQALDALCDGIGAELAELEPTLEALAAS